MAIPIGTTARQVAWMARWMLVGVFVAGMLSWWSPGFRAWGALAASLLVVWMIWLVWRIVLGVRNAPGHPAYRAMAVPIIVLMVHAARAGIFADPQGRADLAGAINMSLLFQMSLLALGIMLVQSLLSQTSSHALLVGICGAAMMGGTAAAVAWGAAAQSRSALALLGFGGIGVWVSCMWKVSAGREGVEHSLWNRPMRLGCAGVAAMAAVILAGAAPQEAVVCAAVVAVTLVVGAILFRRGRRAMLLCGLVLAAAVAIVVAIARPMLPVLDVVSVGWFGRGEGGFSGLNAADGGLAILLGMIGWFGTGWLVLGLAGSLIWMLWKSRNAERSHPARALVWAAATAVITCAFLAPGGLSIPAVTLAMALTWGLSPEVCGQQPRMRSGLKVSAVVVALVILLGLTRNGGLVVWSAVAFGADDKIMHAIFGFFLAMVLIWQMGLRRVWWGLAGVLLAIAIGAMGELAQGVTTWRSKQLADWLAGAVGSVAAVVPYLLSVGSRRCESAEARAPDPADYEDYRPS